MDKHLPILPLELYALMELSRSRERAAQSEHWWRMYECDSKIDEMIHKIKLRAEETE